MPGPSWAPALPSPALGTRLQPVQGGGPDASALGRTNKTTTKKAVLLFAFPHVLFFICFPQCQGRGKSALLFITDILGIT